MTETHNPYTQQLRDELLKAAHKEKKARHKRSRRIKAFGPFGVIAVLIVALATFFMEQTESSANALSVQEQSGELSVQLNSTTASSKQIVRELKAHGVNATVVLSPAAPPQVGKFLSVGTVNEDFKISSSNAGAFTSFTIKKDAASQISLYLGRTANDGETYMTAFDTFSTGGALHCAGVWGTSLSTSRAFIEKSFKTVRYQAANNATAQTNVDNYLIVGASQFSADSVLVVLVPAITESFQNAAPDTSNC